MAIRIPAPLKQTNNADFAILEDLDIKGGLKSVNTVTEMNAIPTSRRKAGLRVYVKGDGYYSLSDDLTTFTKDSKQVDMSTTIFDISVRKASEAAVAAGNKTNIAVDTLIIKSGTTIEWTAANPVLALGEFGLDTTTKRFKIGDGITAFSALKNYDEDVLSAVVSNATTLNGKSDTDFALATHSHKYAASLTESGAATTALALDSAIKIILSKGATGSVSTTFNGNATINVTKLDPNYLSAAVPIEKGGTGVTTLEELKTLVGDESNAGKKVLENAVIAKANFIINPTYSLTRYYKQEVVCADITADDVPTAIVADANLIEAGRCGLGIESAAGKLVFYTSNMPQEDITITKVTI